ncbi:glycosyltransferase family 2 protein [Photobacterium leiognathi]|uniref:glycosyltransferase family 2 protein n=2 Tax=Photobacterium leiognathi TaxID=553611 RepID=UPI002981D050|nr:glycosyltransferase family 2 protein [Photobacterium leiognathi]
MIKVSIITPIYNAEKYIIETIESVINQTYKNWEYILVDDCSTDNTVNLINDSFRNDSRIKVISSPSNGGAGLARNIGLEKASSNYIAFLDSDDLWSPTKLEKQIEFMQANNSAIVHCSYSFIDEESKSIPGRVNVSKYVDLNSYMKNTEIGMSTSLINRNIVGDFRLNPMRTRQDTKLWITLLGKGFIANGLDDDLVLYRIRHGQISGNKFVIAWRTLKLYLSVDSLPLMGRLSNFTHYAFNGIFKRLKK